MRQSVLSLLLVDKQELALMVFLVIAHTTENCADKGTPVFPTASGVKDLVCTSAPGGASFVAFSVIKT